MSSCSTRGIVSIPPPITARKQWATQQDSSNALTVILPSCTWPACTENAMRNVRICMHNNVDQARTMTMTITAWCLLLGAALFALLLAMKGPVLGFVADCVSDQHHSSLRHQHVVNWANVEHIWELLHVPWCPRLMPGLVNQWLSIRDRVSMTKTLRQFPKSTQATDPRRSFKWSLCRTSASGPMWWLTLPSIPSRLFSMGWSYRRWHHQPTLEWGYLGHSAMQGQRAVPASVLGMWHGSAQQEIRRHVMFSHVLLYCPVALYPEKKKCHRLKGRIAQPCDAELQWFQVVLASFTYSCS